MPPLPGLANPLPRLILYYQTHHDGDTGNYISVLPLITKQGISLTHLILAAIHINEDPEKITVNDHHPSHTRFQTLWAELRILQASGVKVMGMLGGAAHGSYQRLDGSDEQFERFYVPVRNLIRERALDGMDLDVEEEMTLAGAIRLVDRLKADFGKDFIITFTPVAIAMIDPTKNLSGFDYEALEVMRGRDIAWYNAQFYCGWGDISTSYMYDMMVQKGWPPEKVVVGLVTNPANGAGFVPWDTLTAVLKVLRARYERFGGVMGWEYFNGLPGGLERPWEWAREMTTILRTQTLPVAEPTAQVVTKERESDPDLPGSMELDVPRPFEYFSDGSEED